ncbi:hypothetical protein SeLEV6574_g01084 [Synchytrium endobioticum]|uniref:Cas12f1-like TNB domain-containing protein n=1 Tax=Synchytrium endobioticum TaxID=286115 RepID=A0A507DF03_9FUNG|nr:hypothetical protein SeLEV6574_g01084 [Synchytrium endobioticum]
MLPLLKERVVEVVGEEGKQAIEEIEAWVDESLEDDPPSPPPPVQVPHTSFGDGYVTMSEECLFDLLFDIPSFQKTLREVVGLKAKKMATRAAFMKNPSKGRLLDEVNMVDESMGHKLSGDKQVIVAIGMGDFSSAKSRHVMFIRYLIRKLRPLGYTIVGVNEYYTSKKCPCCQEFVEMPAMRRLYCRGYNKWYHRDVMAADPAGT